MDGHYFAVGGVRIPCRCRKRAGVCRLYCGWQQCFRFRNAFRGDLVCAVLAIFMFFGSKEASTGIVALTRRITVWIKNRFIKKEAA